MFGNQPSQGKMEKIGMRHNRTFIEEWDDPLPGAELEEVEYEITRDEWLARQGASRVTPAIFEPPRTWAAFHVRRCGLSLRPGKRCSWSVPPYVGPTCTVSHLSVLKTSHSPAFGTPLAPMSRKASCRG